MNRENLQKLIDYAKTLPDDYEINMECYRKDRDNLSSNFRVPHTEVPVCGTVACFVGLAPYAGIAPLEDERWCSYETRCFGTDPKEFFWLFGSHWANTDNTLSGAVLRAEWYLEHGLPLNLHSQMYGDAPLCYRATGAENATN